MILQTSKFDGVYGVSHNHIGVIVSVNGERILLSPEEAMDMAESVISHVDEHRRGLWCGKPMLE